MYRQYKPIKWYIFAVVIGILSLLAIDNLGLFEGIDNYFYDLSFRLRGSLKPNGRIVVIAIDEKTLEQLGRWPLNRIHYAHLIDVIKEASAVGLDIVMAEPTEDDPELSAAMARYGRVILPVYVEGNSRISYPASTLTSYKAGHVHVEQGVDGVIRKVFHMVYYQGHAIPSFASVLYETATGTALTRRDVVKAGIDEGQSVRIIQSIPMNINYYGPPSTFPRISLIDVLRGHYVPSFFKNKVILVGVTSEGIEDNKLIPFTQHRNRIAGVEVQANILSNLLDKNALQIADERLRLSLIIVISLLGMFLFTKLGEKAATFLWVSDLTVVSASIFFLFVFRNLWISPSLFYWTISFLFVTAYLYKLDKAARQLDMKYLTLNERIGWDVKTNGKENQEKGLISFLSSGGINTKIQRLLTIEQHYEKRLEDTVQKKTEALRKSEAELLDSFSTQALLNTMLRESLENMPLELILQKAVNVLTAIPWFPIEVVGGILIVEDKPDVLVMKAGSNMDKTLCSEVPFGKCLCGQAALTQEIQFSNHLAEHHEKCCEEARLSSQGHYAVPILYGGRTLGTLNIYLKEGYVRDKKEEEFLRAVADTLAGIIMRKQSEEKIEYLAYYDGLTGLPNKRLFIDRLAQGITRSERSKKLIAVLALNIDRFKSINDTYGSDTGDAVLKEVSRRLITSVRDGDTVSRLGDEDFGIFLADIAQSEDIILLVEKIMKSASQPIHFRGKEIVMTLSVGISVYPHDGKDTSALIKNADLALARANQQGRKNYQFYTEGMDVKASEFVLMEKNLFNAIRNEEFILYYQPYWDINTKKVMGMEALIRWISPEAGLVSPGKFIPVLEDTRMIIEVGEWVIKTAIRQVKEWQDKGHPIVPVSVNLSLIQFSQKDLFEMIERVIRESGLYPSLLTIEITESAFMYDVEFTYTVIENLKKIGVSISIDDFGTGYSSLAYLRRFPVDNLKIDMSFIKEVTADPDAASIVTAIINMAHTLNLRTIAEGIETEEQWKILRLLKCDMGQGFYFSKPLPAEEVERFFNQQ